MPTPLSSIYDVIIAGAGPVGLLLACELRLGGCSVLVLEKAKDPDTPLKRAPFGLRGLSVTTTESLDRRDLLDALAARAAVRDPAHRRAIGHFAGIDIFQDQIDDALWPWRLPGPVGGLAVDMAGIEAVLTERAITSGVEIRRGCGVESFEQSEEHVIVRAGDTALRGRWLVGCDGGRSLVRKASGIGFSGTDPEFTGYYLDVDLAEPAMLDPDRQRTATGMYVYSPPGIIAVAEFDGGACHRTGPIARAQVEAMLRRVSGKAVTVRALRLATTWTDRACLATAYRKGRVLLAGDAAHIHSPMGGQGLNLGLGDAMNLGWKLAATVRGHAPEGLLDTYARERRPVAADVLDRSRAQVALMRPGAGSRALEAIVGNLIATRDGATYLAERVCGTGLRYDFGDGHPLVGRSVPDFAFTDGARLNARLRHGKGVLVDFEACAPLRALAGRWSDRIGYIACDAKARLGASALLVRPDGIVAWATPDAAAANASDAVSRWFRTSIARAILPVSVDQEGAHA